MMSISHLLENFDSPPIGATAHLSLSEGRLEDQKLEAFENGYKAGWDDSIKSQMSDQARISSDFEQNLQQLSFTYHEAYAHILKSLNPLLNEIIDKLIPEITGTSLGAQVVHEISQLAGHIALEDIEIVVCPGNLPSLEGILEKTELSSVRLQAEPTLAEGQAFMRFSHSEKQIDLDEVVAGLRRATEGFFNELDQRGNEEIKNVG